MTIAVGETIPFAHFFIKAGGNIERLSTDDIFANRKVVLFALPGAFTPTCHADHLPGYLDHLETIKAKGVDEVAVVSVNDPHVMEAWANSTGGKGKILFLSDGNADFTRAVGMDTDSSIVGMGVRSKRYSMIVENGVVTSFNLEEMRGQAIISGAAAIMEQL
uniref:peroxiredoxin n=1 Tax=Pararhizobium sp. IMCC3301 TaxID=3067904 RepID=UPI00274293C8|nr:peroxiredoxin [Pararhizobium sp. IMCC3301]